MSLLRGERRGLLQSSPVQSSRRGRDGAVASAAEGRDSGVGVHRLVA